MIPRRTLIHPHILFIPHSSVPHLLAVTHHLNLACSLSFSLSRVATFLLHTKFSALWVHLSNLFSSISLLQHQFSPLGVPNFPFSFQDLCTLSRVFAPKSFAIDFPAFITRALYMYQFMVVFSPRISVIAFLQQFHPIFFTHVSSFPLFCTFCFQRTSSFSHFIRIYLFPCYCIFFIIYFVLIGLLYHIFYSFPISSSFSFFLFYFFLSFVLLLMRLIVHFH